MRHAVKIRLERDHPAAASLKDSDQEGEHQDNSHNHNQAAIGGDSYCLCTNSTNDGLFFLFTEKAVEDSDEVDPIQNGRNCEDDVIGECPGRKRDEQHILKSGDVGISDDVFRVEESTSSKQQLGEECVDGNRAHREEVVVALEYRAPGLHELFLVFRDGHGSVFLKGFTLILFRSSCRAGIFSAIGFSD